MVKLTTSDKINVAKSKIANAGRGVFARKDIKKGDEITIKYNSVNPKNKNPLWFE